MISEVKRVEIRDRATFIPALAFRLSGGPEDRLLWRAGFGADRYVILVHLVAQLSHWDPHDWGNRTMTQAHLWLIEHWGEHVDGAVLDVEYVLGEAPSPKENECH